MAFAILAFIAGIGRFPWWSALVLAATSAALRIATMPATLAWREKAGIAPRTGIEVAGRMLASLVIVGVLCLTAWGLGRLARAMFGRATTDNRSR